MLADALVHIDQIDILIDTMQGGRSPAGSGSRRYSALRSPTSWIPLIQLAVRSANLVLQRNKQESNLLSKLEIAVILINLPITALPIKAEYVICEWFNRNLKKFVNSIRWFSIGVDL